MLSHPGATLFLSRYAPREAPHCTQLQQDEDVDDGGGGGEAAVMAQEGEEKGSPLVEVAAAEDR